MVELKSMSYEECRAEHFKGLMKKMQRKIDWWQNKKRHALGPVSMLSRSHLECTEAGMLYSFYNDALEALENQPKWISVKEKEPECECLAVGKYGDMLIGWVYPKGKEFWCENEHEILYAVTHWMPLPEPPKEDA